MSRFAGGQLSALDALCDAVLLVFGALADFALRVGVLHGGVMLVLINLVRQLVLLLVQGGLVCSSQLAVVERAHVLFFVVQVGLFLFEVGGLASRKFAALYAVGNAVLLVFFALVDGLAGHGRGRVGALGHNRQRENRKRCTQKRNLDRAFHRISPVGPHWLNFVKLCGHTREKPGV